MIFLFEEFPYASSFLQNVIGFDESKKQSECGFNTKKDSSEIKIEGVGYCFYNSQPVFVLPKVFVENETNAFGEKIDKDGKDIFGDIEKKDSINQDQRRFLASLSVWLYSAIDKYKKQGGGNTGVKTPVQKESRDFKENDRYATLLDIISNMELFYKKNQSLFVFIAKNKHCGNHKINWQRTVNKKTPFIQDDIPIYLNPVNKVKVFDLDDRLLVLYFSAMKYIQETFGYDMPQNEFYQPLRANEMERLLENEHGLRELHRIKYKYFDDRLLRLYNIMEAFFRWGARYKSKDKKVKEYLIVNSFNNVFEAMVDDLIGDQGKDIEALKNNKDGKIVDHLYKEKSLFASDSENDLIWCIGDSKYYKDAHDLDPKSIAKQYTYAKNILQYFFSGNYVERECLSERDNIAIHAGDVHKGVRYRDPLTEGYNVVPNFFIRGEIPEFKKEKEKEQYKEPYFRTETTGKNAKLIRKDSQDLWRNRNRHFTNRLFDRDTLFLQVYNINFMFVLKSYVSKNSVSCEKFKSEARALFREKFSDLLNEKYAFWRIKPIAGLAHDGMSAEQSFVDKYFRLLVGKIFKPYNFDGLILALEKQGDGDRIACLDYDILGKIQVDCDVNEMSLDIAQ
ncbi:hypothetical protein FSU_1830 [Fibrobacter succinogenes subsp. succinogenes S85]|uniref:LlaJI restriction endonuclease n=1 Tax=Fibrobacter succinogenes (strain ATCC 19169 / S85) TaxID=59374 RepID=C9RQX5_FIBSS|nr:LlaJI family restriction endonuclease [Fibrobacter succinogenes]ACX74961.1 hypothetical protein Fisuc_1363 [Fibrobacter succinogenes subsp. succinogenes S85]ADL26295.1 hypothetical protein FSU_1830 [Fibrobacter succinogenes subsp. succinogenes S85]